MKSAFSKSAKDPAIKESKDAKKKEDKAVMKDKVGFGLVTKLPLPSQRKQR